MILYLFIHKYVFICLSFCSTVPVVAQCEKEEEKLVTENANLRKEVNQLNDRLTQAEIRNGSRFSCLASGQLCMFNTHFML